MKKVYFNCNQVQRDDFYTGHVDEEYETESIDEFVGENVLEKIPYLISFVERLYVGLKPGGTATFTAPYYDAWQAWQDPRNIRGMSQGSLNFASKTWREQNGCPDLATCDFEVGCNFAVDLSAIQRSDAAREFWLARYKNVVQSIMFVLTKKEA